MSAPHVPDVSVRSVATNSVNDDRYYGQSSMGTFSDSERGHRPNAKFDLDRPPVESYWDRSWKEQNGIERVELVIAEDLYGGSGNRDIVEPPAGDWYVDVSSRESPDNEYGKGSA